MAAQDLTTRIKIFATGTELLGLDNRGAAELAQVTSL